MNKWPWPTNNEVRNVEVHDTVLADKATVWFLRGKVVGKPVGDCPLLNWSGVFCSILAKAMSTEH